MLGAECWYRAFDKPLPHVQYSAEQWYNSVNHIAYVACHSNGFAKRI